MLNRAAGQISTCRGETLVKRGISTRKLPIAHSKPTGLARIPRPRKEDKFSSGFNGPGKLEYAKSTNKDNPLTFLTILTDTPPKPHVSSLGLAAGGVNE